MENIFQFGNWVYKKNPQSNELEKQRVSENDLFNPELLYPILLNSEWFIEFGFELINISGKEYFVKQVKNKNKRIIIHQFDEVYFFVVEVNDKLIAKKQIGKYVHELQNSYLTFIKESMFNIRIH